MRLPVLTISGDESVTVTVERPPGWDWGEMVTVHADGRITFTDGCTRHGEIRPAYVHKEEA